LNIQDNKEVLHHILLYVSQFNYSVGQYTDCSSMPKGAYAIYGWAPGGDIIDIPEEAGYRVGNDEAAPKFLILQMHYDNPMKKSGFYDSSGLRLFLTDKLRPNDAGFMFFGVPGQYINIPPHQDNWHQAGICDVTNGIKNFPGEKLHVFSYLCHEHLLGKQMWTEVIRNNEKFAELGRELNYNFNNQRFIPISFDILPGDQLITRCVWSSTHKNVTTFGGESTRDEMCIQAILYYPSAKRRYCSTNVTSTLSCEYPCNEQLWSDILKPDQDHTVGGQELYYFGITGFVILMVGIIGLMVFLIMLRKMKKGNVSDEMKVKKDDEAVQELLSEENQDEEDFQDEIIKNTNNISMRRINKT